MKMSFAMVCVAMALLVIALSAQADELPNSQWKLLKDSLADLVGKGYIVVAVTSETSGSGVSTQTFFLQRDTSFRKCAENHLSDFKARKSSALFLCWELTQPYVFPARTR
jgi:outer membrane lipoprotein-sorting protein